MRNNDTLPKYKTSHQSSLACRMIKDNNIKRKNIYLFYSFSYPMLSCFLNLRFQSLLKNIVLTKSSEIFNANNSSLFILNSYLQSEAMLFFLHGLSRCKMRDYSLNYKGSSRSMLNTEFIPNLLRDGRNLPRIHFGVVKKAFNCSFNF